MNTHDPEAPEAPSPLFVTGSRYIYCEKTGPRPTDVEDLVVRIATPLGEAQPGHVLVSFPDGHKWDVPVAELKPVEGLISISYADHDAEIQVLEARIHKLEIQLSTKQAQLVDLQRILDTYDP
jgi:hypothetical protein